MSTVTTTEIDLTLTEKRRRQQLSQKLGDALNLIAKAINNCSTPAVSHLSSASWLIRHVLKEELTKDN